MDRRARCEALVVPTRARFGGAVGSLASIRAANMRNASHDAPMRCTAECGGKLLLGMTAESTANSQTRDTRISWSSASSGTVTVRGRCGGAVGRGRFCFVQFFFFLRWLWFVVGAAWVWPWAAYTTMAAVADCGSSGCMRSFACSFDRDIGSCAYG